MTSISEADSVHGTTPWQVMWIYLEWSTHHGSFVVSTQKKPPILQLPL